MLVGSGQSINGRTAHDRGDRAFRQLPAQADSSKGARG